MYNREFAKTNLEFQQACQRAQIPVSTRQASKWRRKKGKAWKLQEEK